MILALFVFLFCVLLKIFFSAHTCLWIHFQFIFCALPISPSVLNNVLSLSAHFRSLDEINSVRFACAMHIVLLIFDCFDKNKYYFWIRILCTSHLARRGAISLFSLLIVFGKCLACVVVRFAFVLKYSLVIFVVRIPFLCLNLTLFFTLLALPSSFFSYSVARDSAPFAVLSRLSISFWCV